VTECRVTGVESVGVVFVYALVPYCTYEVAGWSVLQLTIAEFEVMDDTNTPETTGAVEVGGGAVAAYS
jgi:hypothetical protein